MQNPFTLEFGVQPPEYIDRFRELSEIKEDFSSAFPSTHMYALLGPRGCGKTVMLNDLYDTFQRKEGWIVANLNCKSDMLLQLASILDERVKTRLKHLVAEFSFSFSFLSLTIKGKEQVSSLPVLIDKMFETLSRHNIHVLVTVDDIAPNNEVEIFAKQFQALRGRHTPIFLVMTGLYSTFNVIQSKDGLTFLQRANKCYLGPLNKAAISISYQETLRISKTEADELADFTKGYAFAYQCLGYLLVKNQKTALDDAVIARFDYLLEEGVYVKLVEELSEKELEVLRFVATHKFATNEDLISSGVLSPNTISRYKGGLIRKGLLIERKKAMVEIALPRFEEFVLSH